MHKTQNCALIGLGMVADTHLAAIQASDRIALRGVLGRDPARARAFAEKAGGVMVYDGVGALAADPALDFVIIATPPDARTELVAACVAARKPVLLEKPIERSLPAARAIVAQAQAADVPIGVVFQHRARVASIALKEAMTRGDLGQIATVDIRVPWWRAQSYYDVAGRGTYARDGGGVMITQAIHTLDLALHCAGPVARVQAMMHRTPLHDLEAEDWAGGLLEFESGAVGHLSATTAAFPGAAESITVQGTQAAATLCAGVLTIEYLDGRRDQFGETASTGGGADPMAFTHEWHQTVIEDFAEAIATARAPLATGEDGLRAQAVIAAMEEASRTGHITEVPRI